MEDKQAKEVADLFDINDERIIDKTAAVLRHASKNNASKLFQDVQTIPILALHYTCEKLKKRSQNSLFRVND